MYIHVSESTYKLLDRKFYDFDECSQTAINGSPAITTYFVLNKKDRMGIVQTRAFHSVLNQILQQDNSNLERKQNGDDQLYKDLPSSLYTTNVESNDELLTTITRHSVPKRKASVTRSIKVKEPMSEPNNPMRLIHGQSRSKACEIL